MKLILYNSSTNAVIEIIENIAEIVIKDTEIETDKINLGNIRAAYIVTDDTVTAAKGDILTQATLNLDTSTNYLYVDEKQKQINALQAELTSTKSALDFLMLN